MQTIDSLEGVIETHPFLFGLDPKYYHFLRGCATMRRFAAQEQIFQEGEPADSFYVILSGDVALETVVPTAGTATIQTIGSGQALGWSWLFPPYQWHFTARAIEPTEVVAFEAAALRDKAEEDRDFRNEILTRVSKVLVNRLEHAKRQLIDSIA